MNCVLKGTWTIKNVVTISYIITNHFFVIDSMTKISELGGTNQTFSLKALHYETLKPVRIEVVKGFISSVVELGKEDSGPDLFVVAPCLIDNQVNGFAGVDFFVDDLSEEDILKATTSLWRMGVTTYLPTLVTNTSQNLIRNFRIASQVHHYHC